MGTSRPFEGNGSEEDFDAGIRYPRIARFRDSPAVRSHRLLCARMLSNDIALEGDDFASMLVQG